MPKILENSQGMPPELEFDDEGREIKPKGKALGEERTREEMQGEIRGYIEQREFPNRMKVMKFKEAFDIDGNPIPADTTLFYDPSEPVRMRGETIFGLYGDEKGNKYWVKLGDADYGASRAHGYSKARP